MRSLLLAACVLIVSSARADDPPKVFEFHDGDRVVYLGNAFVENDQKYGYLETLITAANPDKTITFRNLGWSGDTVWGDARAGFGTRADGFKHLKEHVFALKPTVIFVAYGMNESFAGEAGLPEFEKGLNTLLDTLAETKARMVLISPIQHENLGPPLPDPTKHNGDLRLYRDVMARVASSRSLRFVDLLGKADGRPLSVWAMTGDGLHPTSRGYAYLGSRMFEAIQGHPSLPRRELDLRGATPVAKEWVVSDVERLAGRVKFRGTAHRLPEYLWPNSKYWKGEEEWSGGGGFQLCIRGVPHAKYELLTDNKASFFFPVVLDDDVSVETVKFGPEIHQVEKLRAVINKKNELYFHRWRPANETYIFGFRKHEQGNNSVEIPQFDPLIERLEAEIAVLKKPVPHTYELIREEAGK